MAEVTDNDYLKRVMLQLLRDHDWGSDELDLLGLGDSDGSSAPIIERAEQLLNPVKPAFDPSKDDSLVIEWDEHNYLSFSVAAPDGDAEKEAALDVLIERENEMFNAARTDEERAKAEDEIQIGFTLDWGRTAAEMADNCRRAAAWLDAVSARFPGHTITTNID